MRTITILILLLVAVVAPHAPRANPSAAQSVFATAYNTSTNGLVSWWKLESDSGGVAVDQMGDNDGTWEGGASSTDAAGFVGNGGDFDGTNDYIAGNNPLGTTATPFSLSLWIVSTGDTNENPQLIMKKPAGMWLDGMWLFQVSKKGADFRIESGGDLEGVTHWPAETVDLTDEEWHHAVATMNSTGYMVLYLDGKIEGAHQHSSGLPAQYDAPIYVGVKEDSNGRVYFNGSIDEVRIYNRALSAHEIRRLYLQGHSQSDEVNE